MNTTECFFCFSSMRRDVLVRMSSKGLLKTGLSADVCQASVYAAAAALTSASGLDNMAKQLY